MPVAHEQTNHSNPLQLGGRITHSNLRQTRCSDDSTGRLLQVSHRTGRTFFRALQADIHRGTILEMTVSQTAFEDQVQQIAELKQEIEALSLQVGTKEHMIAGLIRVLIWVIGVSPARYNKRILRTRYMRIIVVLWICDPWHYDCASQAAMAKDYGFDKQSFGRHVQSFKRTFDFADVRFRSPIAIEHMRRRTLPIARRAPVRDPPPARNLFKRPLKVRQAVLC